MTIFDGTLSRSDFLKAGAAGALGLTLAGSAYGRSIRLGSTTLNWLTWSDHYFTNQLAAVNKKPTQIRPAVQLISDDSDAYT